MLRFAAVPVGVGEPLGCVRCSGRGAPAYAPSAEVIACIATAIESWEAVPGPNIVLCGPEPFAHPQLPQLVAACVARGVQRVCIETDGGALAVRANAEGVLASGVRQLWVRVLAASEPAAGDLSGRPGLLGSAKAGVQAFLEAAKTRGTTVTVTAVVPVCAHTLEALPGSVGELASWGVHAVRLVSSGPLPDSAAAYVTAACDTGMVNRLWVETDGELPLPDSHRLHAVAEAACHG